MPWMAKRSYTSMNIRASSEEEVLQAKTRMKSKK